MLKKAPAVSLSGPIEAFPLLGRFVVRAPWLVIGAWIGLVVVLALVFQPLTKVVENQPMKLLPPAAMVAAEQMAEDFGESSQNVLIVVLTDGNGLQPGAEDVYRKLAATLRADTDDVTSVQDFLTTPALRSWMASEDNKAFFMAVTLRSPAGSPESSQAYQRITETAKQSTAGTPLTANVTGQAAMVGDLSIVTARDMHMIEIGTGILVLVILLVIYRRPVTVLLPLVTIGISVAAAQGVVSALTHVGVEVSMLTIVLMTAMIVGAGTDYAVFLISRYHEFIRQGMDSDKAVQKALTAIGKVIAASAATVAVTFLGMVFTRLSSFTSVGPALAVSIAIAFLAAVTLLPAILVLTGRRGWVKPRRALTGRMWRRSAVHIVRRPKTHLAVSVAVLIALAGCAAFLRPSFNDRLQLPRSAESNVGFAAMQQHFSTSTLLPQYIYIHSPHDLRTPQALADMEQMAQRVSQLPDIAAVRGITRPDGQQFDQTKLSYQAGQVGDTLQGVSNQIADRSDDLDALTSGADQLATALAHIRGQLNAAGPSLIGLNATVDEVQHQLDGAVNLLEGVRGLTDSSEATVTKAGGLVGAADSMLAALDDSPQCNADPSCSAGRAQLAQALQAGVTPSSAPAVQDLRAAADELIGRLRTASHNLAAVSDGAAVQQELADLRNSADALADGSARLAQGVRALVDQTKQMGTAMNQTSDLLMSIQREASPSSMAGMYIPSSVITTDDFKSAARLFISPDGHSARYVVESKFDPFSTDAMDQVTSILDTARAAQPNTSLADASISMVGTTAMYSAIRSYYYSDLELIIVLTLLIVFLILAVLLRAIVAPLYLIASVVISYLSALGMGVLVFQFLLGQAIPSSVAAMAFIVLVAVGADYNLLLITRIREESASGIRTGIIRAVRSTGGVITSAGIIFAASMFGLLLGSVSTMVQTGFIIGVGLLIDTFVVRTITVPAMAALIGSANWWPSRATRAEKINALAPRACRSCSRAL